MKIVLFILVLLSFIGCETSPVRPDIGGCMEHIWIKGTYKIQIVEGLDTKLKNISGGDDRVISAFDRGWSEVKCP